MVEDITDEVRQKIEDGDEMDLDGTEDSSDDPLLTLDEPEDEVDD